MLGVAKLGGLRRQRQRRCLWMFGVVTAIMSLWSNTRLRLHPRPSMSASLPSVSSAAYSVVCPLITGCRLPSLRSGAAPDMTSRGRIGRGTTAVGAAEREGDVQEIWPNYNLKTNRLYCESSLPLWALKYKSRVKYVVPPEEPSVSGGESGEVTGKQKRYEYNVYPILREALGIQNEQNGSDKEKSGLSLGKAGATVLDSNEIQGFEESVVLHNQDHQDRENLEQMILELKRWLKAGGAEFSDLDVKEYFEEVRGIESTSKLSKGSEIISIPLEYIITDILAASSAIGSKIEALFPPSEERTHSYYAMHGYLLEEMEKGSESFWWPYLRLLPRKFPGHPLIWEKKDKKLLSGTLSLKYLNRQLHQLREDYNKMVVGIPGFGRFSFKDFVWAHLVISTRCYSAEIKGVKASAMVPLADMFNHELENPGATWGYQDDHHAFIVTMDKDMERGAQISVPYGGYSSSRLFTHYGFQVPGDRHYDALVVVGFGERAFELMPKYLCAPTIRLFSYLRQEIDWLDKTHPNVSMHHEDYLISFHRRSTALQKLLSVPESDLTFGTNLSSAIPAGGERDTQEMMESVREKEIDLEERIGPAMKNITAEAQLASVENKWEGPEDEQLLDPTKFISRRNEIRVLREIRKACLDALMFFPTTLDKDVEALTKYSSRMSWAQRNCIVATAGEKQTLMWFVTLANIAEPLLTRSKPHVDLFLKRRKELKKDIFTEYIDLVVKPLTRGIWPEDQPGGETSTYSPILKPRKHKGLVSPGIANNTIGE